MKILNKFAFLLLSLPHTIRFNFKAFPLKTAIKLPVFVSHKVKYKGIKRGSIFFSCPSKTFMVKFGNGGSDGVPEQKSCIMFRDNGVMSFDGNANFGVGIIIRLDGGKVSFGKNFRTNKNCFIACNTEMKFGDDVLLGWNVRMRDSDGHYIIENGAPKKNEVPVSVGNHVWICSYADVLKGTTIASDSVVAYRSCVTGGIFPPNSLIAGFPAKVIKSEINWKE